jgi:tol-pal system protein YbgF
MSKDAMIEQFIFPAFCLLLAFCLLTGCATTQDVDSLRVDVNRLLKESYAAKSDIESLKEKTAGVAKEESFNVVRMSQAEIQSQLSTVAGDIQKLNGRFDENKYFLEKTLKESSAEMDLLKTQMTSMEKQIREIKDRLNALEGLKKQPRESAEQEQTKEPDGKQDESQKEAQPDEGKTAKSKSPDNSVQQYEEAYSAFKNKHYKEAREKFEAFIKAFPKDERTDNAYFWVAETYYNEKDFEGAILAYETHLKKYPKSQKAPAALLKQGLSFLEIGDKKTGTVIFEQLIERYPKTKEADLAKKQVAKLKKTKK